MSSWYSLLVCHLLTVQGKPEEVSKFDIDLVMLVSPEDYKDENLKKEIRKRIAGTYIGGLAIMPCDVEIDCRDKLTEFFLERDITQNEILAIRLGNTFRIFCSKDCMEDMKNNVARPSVRVLNTTYEIKWILDEKGNPVVNAPSIVRSIIRYLKVCDLNQNSFVN